MLCLSLPPIVLFTLTPLWGGRGQPHWTMPGWFFAFALMGTWANELGASTKALRRWALVTAALLAAIAALAVVQLSTGWPWSILTTHSGVADPMLESFEWSALKNAPIFHSPPDFVISTKWSDAGKIAVALGREFPFWCCRTTREAGLSRMRVAGLWGKAASSLRQRPKLQRPLPRPGPYLPSWDSPSFMHLVVAAALKLGSRSFRRSA